jgi:hypothetical protein
MASKFSWKWYWCVKDTLEKVFIWVYNFWIFDISVIPFCSPAKILHRNFTHVPRYAWKFSIGSLINLKKFCFICRFFLSDSIKAKWARKPPSGHAKIVALRPKQELQFWQRVSTNFYSNYCPGGFTVFVWMMPREAPRTYFPIFMRFSQTKGKLSPF